MEINITNKEKIYQAKLKDKFPFWKCLKHLYLFTDKIFLACNKTIMHILSTKHCLSKLVLLFYKTVLFSYRCKKNKDNHCDFTHFASWCYISQTLCHCSFAEGYFINNVNTINTSKKYLDWYFAVKILKPRLIPLYSFRHEMKNKP